MKKRILSILLCLCMAACMLPTVAFAAGAENDKAIQLGTDALSKNVNTEAAPTVYFGQDHGNNPAAWRVIGYDGSGVAGAQGDMTLLAAGTMGEAAFDSINYSSEYAPSELKTAIDALEAKLTTEENAAVKKRTLASGSYNGENTDCVAGAQVDNAVFWPLSIAEAHAVNQDLRIVNKEHTNWAMYHWWLRSPCKSSSSAAVVHGNGEVLDDGMYHTSDEFGVRPAFNLNLNAVLFASAAVGGKPDGGLTPISEYTGNEWKLTLLDNSRNFAVTEKTVSGDTITFSYSNAQTGTNEYISVIIKDNGEITHYGRILHLGGTTGGASGTASLTLPAGITLDNDTKLYVFNEQYNGDKKTDYASDFTDITLTVEKQADEQFTLAPGYTYYFDLSAMGIPGTVNDALPDNTLHYVPFTYAGTVNAYKITSETATTEAYAQKNKYPHSLFVADYAVTHTVSWDDLNTAGLIFGKDYAAAGVGYTLRAPSVGSDSTGWDDSQRGVPQSNEWDTMLNKNSGYIQNWNILYSWGQDAYSASGRAFRGFNSARFWISNFATYSNPYVGFRPVLEVLNPDTLGSDGLKVVTLDLNGGKLGGSSEDIQIIVKNGSEFTAPASDGMTRPDGNNGSYFMWLGSDGNLYAPGESVPEVVTTLTAQWTVNQYTITYDLAGGTVEGNPDTYTIETVAFTLKNPTKSGYTFTGWSGTGLDGENNMTVTIPKGSTGNRSYTAHWRYNGGGGSGYSYYTIKATAGAGGSISPSGSVSVREGRDQTFTITPDKDYAVANVKIDGKSIGAVKSYTFENVRRTHTIEVIFVKANGNPQTGVFVDVATGSYYEDAVDWAVENGITQGTDDTHFSPDGICTRAQAATFLWRAAGSPKPETRTMPFTDVPAGSYYYDAVLWAVENGITKGTSNTTFSPNMTCSRAQIVAFLWRSEKSPAAGTANPFADVKSTAYYADAVLWAVKEDITKGTTNTTFSPDADCTRAQIVTFLWRCKK